MVHCRRRPIIRQSQSSARFFALKSIDSSIDRSIDPAVHGHGHETGTDDELAEGSPKSNELQKSIQGSDLSPIPPHCALPLSPSARRCLPVGAVPARQRATPRLPKFRRQPLPAQLCREHAAHCPPVILFFLLSLVFSLVVRPIAEPPLLDARDKFTRPSAGRTGRTTTRGAGECEEMSSRSRWTVAPSRECWKT